MAKAKKEKKAKGEKKKGGKKKLLLLLIPVAAIAALAAVAVLFILPRFAGGQEEKPPENLEAYTIGEDTTVSLDTILEEGEGVLLLERKVVEETNEADSSGSSSSAENLPQELHTYIYELEDYAAVMERYLDTLLGGEQGFSLVDEEFLIQEDRPELEGAGGKLLLARASAQSGRVFQLALGWSENTDSLVVRISTPEGKVHEPEPDPPSDQTFQPHDAAGLEQHMNQLLALKPSELGLPGESMDEYEIQAMVGFVSVDGIDCRRFTFYDKDRPGTIAGIFMISSDQKHVYQWDPDTGGITELR